MKLKNKKTGEIVERIDLVIREEGVVFNTDEQYTSLADINEEWEDAPEELKKYWFIDCGTYEVDECEENEDTEVDKEIGNYFETKEEAEKAVEKLKAWKRLKDKGFRFTHWKCTGSISFTFDNYCSDGKPMSASDDLDLLFSGEDD